MLASQIIWVDEFWSPGEAEELARLLEEDDLAGCAVLGVGCGPGLIERLSTRARTK